MLDLTRIPESLLSPVALVVTAALEHATGLAAGDVMIVGACCRDILHNALGHTFANTATRDLDLALALSTWQAYESLASAFKPVGETGIRFRIAGIDVDLIPFAGIEDPAGLATPRSRGESLSVWAFEEIFAASLPLPLSADLTIRIPTPAGYAAARNPFGLAPGGISKNTHLAVICEIYSEGDYGDLAIKKGYDCLVLKWDTPVTAPRLRSAPVRRRARYR